LPATTFLEHSDLYKSFGQTTLQLGEKVFAEPRGQARCNHAVVNELAAHLEIEEEAFALSVDETIDQILADSGLSRTDFAEQGFVDCGPSEEDGHFRHGFLHPDRRFHFYPRWSDPTMPELPDHWPVRCADDAKHAAYPLELMLPPARDVLNSTFTTTEWAAKRRGSPELLLHPTDAAARSILDGDTVRVHNAMASITLRAKLSDEVRPGLCLCYANHLGTSFPEEVSLNALAHDHPAAPNGGPAFHDNRVEVERA
jgi:anaerobic selenocysteine-containing dehydrogenase